MADRYQVEGTEGQFEPGSGEAVLANKVGIIDPDEMADLELRLLEELYYAVLGPDFPDRRLWVSDLKAWHRRWLGNVYGWAGEERTVNMQKGDFPFAAAGRIGSLLRTFEEGILGRFTPCHGLGEEELIHAIAVVHVEFILIHPFREGNGRLARLLADVMAVQAGREPMDYTRWEANRGGYFAAIQYGMGEDYELMRSFVREALQSG